MSTSLIIVCIVGFLICTYITKLLWRVAKSAALILIVIILLGTFSGSIYLAKVKDNVLQPIKSAIKNKTVNYQVLQKEFKKDLGVLGQFAAINVVKNKDGTYNVKFKIFGVTIDEMKNKK